MPSQGAEIHAPAGTSAEKGSRTFSPNMLKTRTVQCPAAVGLSEIISGWPFSGWKTFWLRTAGMTAVPVGRGVLDTVQVGLMVPVGVAVTKRVWVTLGVTVELGEGSGVCVLVAVTVKVLLGGGVLVSVELGDGVRVDVKVLLGKAVFV